MLHITHGTAHIRILICTPTGSHHGPWNSLVLYLGGIIGVQWAVDSAIGTGFYKLLSLLAKLYMPQMPLFICQHSAITETTVKQRLLAIIWFDSHWESPGFFGIHAIFSGINTRDASLHGEPSLYHIPTSFVHIGPISLLTNRPCHGPWTGLGDSGTVWP